jgi:hypothetical protein
MDPSTKSAVRSMAALGLKRAPRAARGVGRKVYHARGSRTISLTGAELRNRSLPKRQPLTQPQDRRFAGIAALGSLLSPSVVSCDPGHWAVGHRCLDHAHGRAANTHLTTAMIAEKLADEIRREAKAGSVEHSRPGANVCIWHKCEVPTGSGDVCCWGVDRTCRGHHETDAFDPQQTSLWQIACITKPTRLDPKRTWWSRLLEARKEGRTGEWTTTLVARIAAT